MSENIIQVLEKAMEGADKDRDYLIEQKEIIQIIGDNLRQIIYLPCTDEDYKNGIIPIEFSEPEYFVTCWDALDRAIADTQLFVWDTYNFGVNTQTKQPEKTQSSQPIIIMPSNQNQESSKRQPGSGFWDWRIANKELATRKRKTDKPTIITEKVTYDPREVIHQIIPTLNQLKKTYFHFLHRHESNRKTSVYLLKHGHSVLQEQMSCLFNRLSPYAIASIKRQIEKIRKDKLNMAAHFSKIAAAEAEARAYSQVYIPPEVKAFSRALAEGRTYHPEGMKFPSSDEVANRKRKRE